MVDFPTLINKPDSKKYSISQEDPAVRSKMEGGYVVSRPRHTRPPRLIWTVGYTFIPDSDKTAILDFYADMHGGSEIFRWLNHENSVWYYVRFADQPTYRYVGAGLSRRWDIDFKLEQA
jgi:hypothetical protein